MLTFVLISCLLASAILMVYGVNCHVLIHLFRRRLREKRADDQRLLAEFHGQGGRQRLPVVTTQLPIYNERQVAERVIEAVARFRYPAGKHQIQVLDDSGDDTRDIVARKVAQLRGQGVWIELVTRPDRRGFKAGALRHGMESAAGEFLAIFDADFVPPPEFLLRVVPFFVLDPGLGLVQARWGHLNAEQSMVTALQSIGINGHFMIEQSARNWNGLFMNFNGTAGVFRKKAIEAAGNWQGDTLTEDMDLSYRMQLAGWGSRFLIDLVAPAEIPSNINDFKSQQFRWAKGSTQTALKLLPRLWRSPCGFFAKLQATLHMTHYFVHPLIAYISLMAPLLVLFTSIELPFLAFALLALLLLISSSGPSRLYLQAERILSRRWYHKLVYLPFLVCFGCGLALNNSRAVLEALLGRRSEFVRTPKRGGSTRAAYRPQVSYVFLLEIMLGLWCLAGLIFYTAHGKFILRPFLVLYATGFCYVGMLSMLQRKR